MSSVQSNSALPDSALVEAIRAGETSAFETLLERHAGRLRSVLLRMTSNPERVDDLAQEALVRAYRGLEGFRGDSQFGTWLIQIGIHLLRDGVRRERRHPVLSFEDLRDHSQETIEPIAVDSWSDPSDAVEEDELQRRLLSLLQELPPQYREVFVLHHIHDMPYEEISSVAGASIGTLKVRAHRARKLLKERLFDSDLHDRSTRREVSS